MLASKRATSFSLFGTATPWLIVMCGMLFYCFNYFIRVSPSVMQNELMQAFHISATQFGSLAAFYYYSYTPMQLPAGMIYDKFGVRFVLCVACLLAVMGLGVFVSADSYLTACLGRLLIGLGSAFAYIGTLKLASIWLAPNRFATVAGLTTAAGMTSGALAQKYLTHIVEMIGYKQALHTSLIAGIILAVIIVLIVRNRPATNANGENEMQTPMNMKQLLQAIITICRNPQMWLIGAIGFLLYLPSSVFLDLWGIPYLKAVYHLTAEQAVAISGYTYIGWIISGPLIGIFSDFVKRRRAPLTFTGFFAALLLCIVFYYQSLNVSQLNFIFFFIGFCCGAHPLCFALGKENNPNNVSGTAVAVTNMLIMLGGVIFQPLVGKLLDLHASGALGPDGLRLYTASDYTFALSVVPIGVALGIFLSIFLRETYCTSVIEEDEKAQELTPSISTAN